MTAPVTLTGLNHWFGPFQALKDIDLAIDAGEYVTLLGPSGCGKTTLLSVLGGFIEPTRGEVRIGGRDMTRVPPARRPTTTMFQDYALFPHKDVAANVAFGLRMQGRGGSEVRARVRELLELVGLPGAEERPVSQLSGGEQQRVALARALAPRPRLLMLDEPMGSLDRALRERLPEELRAIFGELGLTVLYVTHDQDEALSVADRVVLLADGRLVADGTPEELWTHPPTAWTARFLGFRNLAPGRLVEGVLETPWGRLSAAGASGNAAAGEVTVVLRPAALVPAADGPIRGRVEARRFRGDHVLLMVGVAGAPTLQVEAREGELPAVGADIALVLRPGGAHVIGGGGR